MDSRLAMLFVLVCFKKEIEMVMVRVQVVLSTATITKIFIYEIDYVIFPRSLSSARALAILPSFPNHVPLCSSVRVILSAQAAIVHGTACTTGTTPADYSLCPLWVFPSAIVQTWSAPSTDNQSDAAPVL